MNMINTVFIDMPGAIHSYVVNNNDMSYTIVLNSRLTREQNLLSYYHELSHIGNGDYDKKCAADIIEISAHET